MAKGTIAKQEIIKEILSHFEGAFLYNDGKEIRIPWIEEGEDIQIKVALTCAKTNVEPGEDNAIPGANKISKQESLDFSDNVPKKYTPPTMDEKEKVEELLSKLNLK